MNDYIYTGNVNMNDIFIIRGNDPFKDVTRTATQDYLNGQQVNTITNLSQQAINDAQQAQQGGSSGGGGGNPASQGILIVNDTPNVVDRLYYLKRVVKDFETNYQNSLIYLINTNPILQSIQKDGRNSPFVQVLLTSNPAIGPLVDGLQKDMNELLHFQEMVANGASPEKLKEFLLQKTADISNAIGYLDSLYKATVDPNGGIPGEVSLALAFLDVQVKQELANLTKHEFNTKYPNAYDEAWSVATPIPGFVGYNELGIYVPASAYQEKIEARDHAVEMLVRANNPDLYDKMNLRKFDLESSKAARNLSIASYATERIGIVLISNPETTAAGVIVERVGKYLGIATPWLIQGLNAWKKADYLDRIHDGEQHYALTLLEQLFNKDYGTFKNQFKGNENPSSSRSVAEPSSNTSLKQLRSSGLLLNAVATTTSLVLNGSAGNDTLVNVQDNYLIESGDGNDEISNVGDHVTVNAGGDNNYVANLGDNVKITGHIGNNGIDNAGFNVTINVSDGDNIISNGGDYVTVTAGNGNNYVDNVGSSSGIWLGNGANDVENFGSNVTVNTGSGVDFIVNYGGNTTVNTGSGRDVVFNSYGSYVLINTDQDDDYISVKEGSDRVTINSGSGSDVVINNGTNAFINLGADNDFIYNDSLGNGATISGLDGADSLENRAANVSINGGAGDNRIINDGVAVTMIGGDSADTIANAGNAALINAGNGNNSVGNAGDTVSIFTGNGFDTILNEGYNVTINVAGGINQITNKGSANSIIIDSGNNTIQNYGEATNIKSGTDSDVIMNGAIDTTIDSGNGLDTILNYLAVKIDDDGNATDFHFNSNNVSINGGSGDDYIENMGAFGTIEGGNGNDTIKNFGVLLVDQNGDIIKTVPVSNYYYQIDAGDGNNLVYNENANATIMSGMGADLIENVADTININAGDGANTIANVGSTVTIQSGSGNDSIESEGSNVTISAGAGNDFIHNYSNGFNSYLNGGDGANIIENDAQNVTIDARGGNDHIANAGSNTTIHAGRGNDTIFLDTAAQNNVIKYKIGDGNKVIYGYNSTTTIKINGSDSGMTSNGNDVIVTIGEGTITLKNASGISDSNIIREDEPDPEIIIGTEGADTINNSLAGAVIFGLGGADSITNNGANVLIDGGDAGDYIYSNGESVTIKGGKGNDTLYGIGSETILFGTGDGSDVINNWQNENLISLTSGTTVTSLLSSEDIILSLGYDSLTLKNAKYKLVQIDNVDGTQTILNEERIGKRISNSLSHQKTLIGGLGHDSIYNYGFSNVLIKGDEGNDFIVNRISDGVVIGFSYDVTIDAGTGNDTIQNNNGKRALLNGGLGNDIIENFRGESALINGDEGDDFIKNLTSLNTSINGGLGNDTIENVGGANALLNGGEGNDFISNKKIDFTGSNYVLSDNVTIDAGTGNDTITNEGNNVLFIYSGGNDSIVGFNETSTLQIGNGTGTYSQKTVGDDIVVTVSENTVTIKGATNLSDINILGNEKISWLLNDTIANYGDLFSLTNVKNTDSISVDITNKIVTLKANNLTGKNVSITGDYSLKLGNDVPTSTTKTAGSFTKFKSGTATFKTSSYSDFYSLKNNQVTYTAPSGGKTISIKNLKSSATLDEIKSGITISEQKNGSCKITFKSSDLLTTKAPVISATDVTYTVALDKSLNPSALAPDWKVSGTNASLKSDTSAGYTVSDNKVLYSKKVTGSPQLVLGGLVKNSSLSAPVKKVVTLDSKILGSNASLKSNAGSYTVKLTGNMSKKTFTGSANADTLNIAANNAAVLGGAGNDSFTVSGSKVTITGGKGNDSFKLSGKNPVLIYNTGDGNDTVNFVAGMQISLSGDTQIKTLGKSGSDLLLGFGKNSSIKVTGAKSTDTIKVSDASGSVTLVAGKFDLANSLTFNSKNSSVTVAKNFTGSLAPSDDIYMGGSKLSKVVTINAANVTGEFTLTGNDKANIISAGKNNDEIFGGNGNDSLIGNAGNDQLFGQNGNDSLGGGKGNDSLWGGDGKDVFIYSAGNDVIADFTAGQDKIQIANGKISKTSLSGSDVLFTIGKGSLTVKNAKGKTISLLDSTGKASSTVVGAQALTNSNKASVTIAADMGFVDASKRTKAIAITGNALANTISGGTKNDSIYGATGNDSILGNAGNDKLYGDAGNDVLLGRKGNDSLWGGAGNDSLWGDAGKDTFIYTTNEGTDRIFDYATGDLLKILNVDGSNGSFKSSKYSGGDLTLTINGGGKIIFDDVASTTKFNINGSFYNISGSKLIRK